MGYHPYGTMGDGWTCGRCGIWVSGTQIHSCGVGQNATGGNGTTVSSRASDPQLGRIEALLERIAKALEDGR